VAYGLSEAAPNVAISCWWDAEEDRVAGKLLPQPGVEVRIRAESADRDAAPGEPGEIHVRGWNVMKGYFDKPAETFAVLDSEGWLRTGDLGCLTADGRMQFIGRAKDVIRVGGENVSPAEVEDAMLRHPKIRMVQAVGVPDKRLGEVVAAFVVLRQNVECLPEEIEAWSKDKMAGFKVPRYVRIVNGFEEIGMTASSKVQKKQLAAHAIKLLGLDLQ
jgi:fatty-acyl-CoA synthase